MWVKGIQTIENEVHVEIDQDELFRLLDHDDTDIPFGELLKVYRNKVIQQLFNIKVRETVFVRDGFFCYSEEYHGSHSWFETKKIRKATAVEIQIMETLDSLEVIDITYRLEK